jgi:hypothetical protein
MATPIPGLRRTTPNPNAPVFGAQPFRPENPNPAKAPFDPMSTEDKLNTVGREYERQMADQEMQRAAVEEQMPKPEMRMPAYATVDQELEAAEPEAPAISVEELKRLTMRELQKPQPKKGKKK